MQSSELTGHSLWNVADVVGAPVGAKVGAVGAIEGTCVGFAVVGLLDGAADGLGVLGACDGIAVGASEQPIQVYLHKSMAALVDNGLKGSHNPELRTSWHTPGSVGTSTA